MILGTGIDIADTRRIEKIHSRYGERFAGKILTPAELRAMPENAIPYLAGRFAAREACAKALGTGFSQGVNWLDMEIINDPSGRPLLALSGVAAKVADKLGVRRVHLSISHERDYAVAMVILEG